MSQPWDQILWSDEHLQVMYRDWGLFYTKKQQLDKAALYYNKCLDINAQIAKPLHFRSLCYCDIARCTEGLRDAKAAFKIRPKSAPINLQVIDAYYDLNEFENCKMTVHNNLKKFRGKDLKPFKTRIDTLDLNYWDSVGETLTLFARKNGKAFTKSFNERKKQMEIIDQPLWKMLKEQEKCDVVSILEEEVELLHPREIARRKLCYKNFIQVYFNNSWRDILFLSSLRNNKALGLPQTKKTTPKLIKCANENYNIAYTFLKMLKARTPLYTKKYQMSPNVKLAAKEKEKYLYRIQYQTKRDMYNILIKIRKLRAEGRVKKLSKTVEEIMSEYVILKIHRVMPWKFEFINEVYNILALAYCDKLVVPENVFLEKTAVNRLMVLTGMKKDKEKDHMVDYVFGDKSTYQEADAVDYSYIAYKNRVNALERRLNFTKYSIEKSYIYNAISIHHLHQEKFDECITMCKKTIQEAQQNENLIWILLGFVVSIKVFVSQKKIERIMELLGNITAIKKRINNPKILHWLDLCQLFTTEALKERNTRKSRV